VKTRRAAIAIISRLRPMLPQDRLILFTSSAIAAWLVMPDLRTLERAVARDVLARAQGSCSAPPFTPTGPDAKGQTPIAGLAVFLKLNMQFG
jgi:hypothetical protein